MILTVDLGGVGHANGIVTVNVDPGTDPDMLCDITAESRALSDYFPPNSVDLFKCIHTLEHLWPGSYVPSMAYWLSLLKPGGKLLVVVPDMDGMMRDYAAEVVVADVTLSIIYTLGHPLGSHKWGWTESTLRRDMERAGFVNIQKADYPEYWIYNYAGYEYTGAVGEYRVPNLCLIGEKPPLQDGSTQ